MLDQETKRRIDSARDILVGKVPDPKAQVEQITTALIYKFMDDMDKEAEELGGKAEFFANGYEKYSWSKLMDKRLSGQERLDLYVQAITNMSKNPHIPQLFRDMFKDAFLPYRDFEVLSLFLKEIDWFSYEHSENLGDAFEYLLSVLGSQGEAGQFRTPRHIIDFIVEVVNPKKNEDILDPACGTAGFLISSYKHIIKHNSTRFKPAKEKAEEKIQGGETVAETVLQEKDVYTGDKLSPDEKTKIMDNIAGYDISPDMVKLSMVNLYLHGFSKPKVSEYDTLTSEKRWNESFDVIMANPPFMTPKGGIRPHKRFQVQASRSEVLFVDYILEHLNLNGRAGIIVPEGIIFQSGNAYKRLRKLLIEDGLFAVVSLPPGVFNPYSGVKTSILFFDNPLAKKTDEMLFVKVQNDGFDLGAQRRKIAKNDLPEALKIIEAWKNGEKLESDLALWANKERIAEGSDYNLTGEIYHEMVNASNQKWPLIEIGDICEVVSGGGFPRKEQGLLDQEIPFLKVSDMNIPGNEIYIKSWNNTVSRETLKRLRVKHCPKGTIIFPKIGAAIATNKKRILSKESAFDNNVMGLVPSEKITSKFLYCLLIQFDLSKWASNASPPSMKKSVVEKEKIPLLPIEIQKEIVEQIEVKQNAIENAREVIKNIERERRYFGQSLRKLKDIKWIELGEVCEELFAGGDVPKDYSKTKNNKYLIPIYTNGVGDKSLYGFAKSARVNQPAVTISARGTIGFPAIRKEPFYPAIRLIVAIPKTDAVDVSFLKYILGTTEIRKTGNTIPQLTVPMIKKIKIPLPTLDVQKRLVAETESEEEVILANEKLIDIMEEKINQVLESI